MTNFPELSLGREIYIWAQPVIANCDHNSIVKEPELSVFWNQSVFLHIETDPHSSIRKDKIWNQQLVFE